MWYQILAGLLLLNHQIFTGLQIENFHWSYEKLEFLKPIKLKDEPIKCALIDEQENVIQKFQSISEAARILNLKSPSKIGNVISGKLKNYKGFLFKKI